MANPLAIELHALAEVDSAGNGTAEDIGETRSAAVLVVNVTAVTGDALTLTFATSADGTTFRTVAVIEGLAQAGRRKLYLAELDQHLRVSWAPGTSASFRVVGTAYTVYGDDDGLLAALPDEVYEQSEEWVRIKARIDASSIVETVVHNAHDVPLTTWEAALSKRADQIAARFVQDKHLLNGGGEDENVTRAHDDAMAWIERIRTQEIRQPHTTPEAADAVQSSSGDPDNPDDFRDQWQSHWVDF